MPPDIVKYQGVIVRPLTPPQHQHTGSHGGANANGICLFQSIGALINQKIPAFGNRLIRTKRESGVKGITREPSWSLYI